MEQQIDDEKCIRLNIEIDHKAVKCVMSGLVNDTLLKKLYYEMDSLKLEIRKQITQRNPEVATHEFKP